MTIEHKNIAFKADATGEDGKSIAGYGSIFGNLDRGGDIVAPGAFAESLASGRKVKMLWNHWSDEVLGVWDTLVEDEKGLRVEGRIASTAKGNDIAELLKIGALDSLSIGYRTLEEEFKNGARIIKKAELWEVSVVIFPMNELATIDAVKAADMSKREVEMKLRDAGFSRAVAMKLIAGGYDALKDCSDYDSGKSDLLALLNRRAELLKL